MLDLRKILVIFIVATLFAIFVWAFAEAVYPSPKYEDFCRQEYFPKAVPLRDGASADCPKISGPSTAEQEGCAGRHGMVQYQYDAECPISWACETCQYEYDQAQKQFNYYFFIVSSILGLIAIALGLYLPATSVNQWIATGFMLGGLISLFIGTARYFGELGRFTKPVIILIELLIVIYIFYKKIRS